MNPVNSLALDRSSAIDWYLRNRARSRAIFDLIEPSAYYSRPIALRNPIVFYEGHLPAFSTIALIKRGLGGRAVDERLETLFARGIDPESENAAVPRSGAETRWPSRDEVLAFADRTDQAILDALHAGGFTDGSGRPAGKRAEALYTALEHEAMHQETLLYMWRRLPYEQKRKPAGVQYEPGDSDSWLPASAGKDRATVRIPAGVAVLGADRDRVPFGWDNEFDAHRADVAAFDIDVHNVTNADFLAFVEAGGYRDRSLWPPENWAWLQQEKLEHPTFWGRRPASPEGPGPERAQVDRRVEGACPERAQVDRRVEGACPERAQIDRRVEGARPERAQVDRRVERWMWRGMFEEIPLPPTWPVYVSHAEASAYARWLGRRLPSEPEYHRAAFGEPSGNASGGDREYPWGSEPPDRRHGNFDFQSWEPVPVGSRPAGASAWGVHDLVGNGWEWTSTIFGPFAGFSPMTSYPEYSADFFDGKHYVMKGGSPATARELLRRSFRNWFRPNYPYVYATFRTVGP